MLKLPSAQVGKTTLALTREPAGDLPRKSSARKAEYWKGLNRFADDYGDRQFADTLDKVIAICSGETKPGQAQLTHDGIIPAELLVTYDPEIIINNSSIVANSNASYQAFGYDMKGDARAKTRVRFGMDIAGQAARYCCGADVTNVSLNMNSFSTKRGQYAIGFEICEDDLAEAEFAGFWDLILMLQQVCLEIMMQAECDVAFYGDEQNQLRGLKQLNCPRLDLDKPLDMMTPKELYDFFVFISEYADITQGEIGVIKNSMLHPRGMNALMAQQYESSNGNGCCDTVGEMIARALNNPIAKMRTDYMQTIGTNNTPAAFLYARSDRYIRRDIGRLPMWDAPCYDGSKIKFKCRMNLGELSLLQQYSALLISNLMTANC